MSTFVSFHDLKGNKVSVRGDNVDRVTTPLPGKFPVTDLAHQPGAVLHFKSGTIQAVTELVGEVERLLNVAVYIKHGGERGGPVL